MSFIIFTSIVAFTLVILLLVFVLLFAQSKLVQSGDVNITINGDTSNPIVTAAGSTLLSTLSGQKIFLPSACGGGGTCAMCKCAVLDGGGDVLPTEVGHLNRTEQKEHVRLACQVKVKQDMNIEIPEEIFGIKKWECEVVSNYNVATFIKAFIVRLPEGETLNFEAGGYIQVDVPKCEVDFSTDIDIAPEPNDPAGPDKFKEDWDKFGIWDLKMKNDEEIFRAYSMANHPAEGNIVMLTIRIATPPWDRAKNAWMDVNPGICSSYVFSRKPGDKVTISGPYGEFFIKETEAEMIYVGGGAGMAPMRSHLFHLFHTLKTGRKVTYWYGGRSKRELFYEEDFRQIEKEFPNFQFEIVLSDPLPEDNWVEKKDMDDTEGDGFLGFVHNAVIDQQLKKHESPEDIEFYFCGPPMMNQAVLKMCDDWGVPDENVSFDDFGG
ncbi:NADH:ubiquinone reductase (Na(+)-transporting) subunit F [Gilvimarinus agarilyticus]|uniref:Na(+)-translocating NADH-quinone reductase subunit F n=1 Tax=Reichenbachiella agariperforans TaxID=156994 RepID=A0A1M6W305_REIAG|nr:MULTISPECIES: NADH:ubiquinone reductase (Na(+)-transporting) subunit F [Reichenbachiella]MBU2885841.1 NADH:ubiquinone reductase (Na(+)-transporting) subunit F [Gilvimarinus agarilyticus]MBU2915224.1 NADH:ubiquinone reductase (Na(+)-transporting) subunit F [Reichenbachiella agariperforans]RJE70887.1 NADH:ubiquinone reductase (Na(+)-transporting) subunit F [Reichenbachiella sp. MSK19-1]SHK87996.1 Na+-transporting NADH:ubiquinone oxidoreductase subunit F [Reichenbachiella agariperforans]